MFNIANVCVAPNFVPGVSCAVRWQGLIYVTLGLLMNQLFIWSQVLFNSLMERIHSWIFWFKAAIWFERFCPEAFTVLFPKWAELVEAWAKILHYREVHPLRFNAAAMMFVAFAALTATVIFIYVVKFIRWVIVRFFLRPLLWNELSDAQRYAVEDYCVKQDVVIRGFVLSSANQVRRSDVLAERCGFCEYAALHLSGGSQLLGEMLKMKDIKRAREHTCPFAVDDAPPIHIARLLLFLADNCVIALAGKNKEMPNESKRYKVVDRKTYKGKTKFHLSDEDYDRVMDLVEKGLGDEAESIVESFLDRAYGRSEADGGTAAEHIRRIAQCYPTERNPHLRRNREGTEVLAGRMLPEGKKTKMPEDREILWADGEHWARVSATQLEALQDAYLKRAQAKKAEHEEHVATLTLRNNPPTNDRRGGNVALSKEAAKRSRKRLLVKQKHKESAVSNSRAIVTDDIVAAVQLIHEGAGGRVCNGFIFKAAGNQACFVTARHAIVDGVEVDGFSAQPNRVLIHRPNRPSEIVVVKKCLSEGDDRVVLVLDTDASRVEFGVATMQDTVRVRYFADGAWHDNQGQVTMVTKQQHFFYNISTQGGCCRMPIFNKMGRILGGHYHPGLTVPGYGRCPGAEPENGSIPKGFVAEYRCEGLMSRDAPAAGEVLLPQGKDEYFGISEFVPGKLDYALPFQRVENQKVFPLRSDVDLKWFVPEFVLMKPGTAMLENEISRFWEPVGTRIQQDRLRTAAKAVLQLEGRDASTPFTPPTTEVWEAIVEEMDKSDTSAGDTAQGMSHHAMFAKIGREVLGDPKLPEEAAVLEGKSVMVEMLGDMYEDIVSGDEEARTYWIDKMVRWVVQGKKDRYKFKKLTIGRSIQAPSFVLKAFWKGCFASNDSMWVYRDWMFRAGYNFDLPVPAHRVQDFKDARACLSLDEEAFDRRMLKEFMLFFFKTYLPYLNPGVPEAVCEVLAHVTINSVLVLSDGRCYLKDRGNPSGFPNTLRLNCVVQLLVWCYALTFKLKTWEEIVEFLEQDVLLEICGDDSRVFCFTDRAMEVLDAQNGFAGWMEIWKEHLPWGVKIEGSVVYDMTQPFAKRMEATPPFIGRTVVVMDDLVWTPLWNANRVLAKPLHQEADRTPEQQAVLNGSCCMAIRTEIMWHTQGKIFSPVVKGLIETGMLTNEVYALVVEHVSDAYRYGYAYTHA